PDSPRLAYVYAVALHDTGRAGDAITALEGAHRQRPSDRDVLVALATYLGERGDVKRALQYAEKLAALDPADPTARTLVESLRPPAGRGGGGARPPQPAETPPPPAPADPTARTLVESLRRRGG